MSWTKYFTPAPNNAPLPSPGRGGATSSSYSSYLPEVYAGHPSRIQRYAQYEEMDNDSDINMALDTIADFCTQSEAQIDSPFEICSLIDNNLTETEVSLLNDSLAKWTQINDFRTRIWDMFRTTIKYGDLFFVRDPETHVWLWVDSYSVEMVQIDNDHGKRPKSYFIRGFEFNEPAKFGAQTADMSRYRTNGSFAAAGATQSSTQYGDQQGNNRDPRQLKNLGNNELFAVDSESVIHLSLSSGMDINWPFGPSLLEPVFKTYKQKSLLEDAILIYRVQRAPERRVFYIDTGDMAPHKAREYLETIKNEINQRRIPSNTGGNAMVDTTHNPLSINDDYYFAQGSEGRGSKIDVLPGGQGLGEITDLLEFSKKLARGLKVPPSYMPITDEQAAPYNDGKVGAAMVQEFQFNKFCVRLQTRLGPVFDREFKRYLENSDVVIDRSLFELRFNSPQNFTEYRQLELDQTRANVYSQVRDVKLLSERYKLQRYLGLSDMEIITNEKLWAEENAQKIKDATGSSAAESENDTNLGGVGVREPGDDFGGFDFGGGGEGDMGDEPMDEPAAEAPAPE